MKPTKSASAEDYALMSSFEEVRQQLLASQDQSHGDKPLAHWALPRDRRLPYALLDRSLRDIVHTSFLELTSTPGIGRKKIGSLVMLLRRALEEQSRATSSGPRDAGDPESTESAADFDVALVSESVWEDWRRTVVRFGMEDEKLGKFAASLRDLPTVIWETPLRDYLELSMDEIRGLKTHGDKRVRVVLEVFHTLHLLLGHAGERPQFAFHIQPRFAVAIEQWISERLRHTEVPDLQELRQNLVLPVLNQIELDAGEVVHRLAVGRLGLENPPESVREQAGRLGVTRARVYQLLEVCARVMHVRWPEGRWQLHALVGKFPRADADDECTALFRETRALLYPDREPSHNGEQLVVETAEAAG